MATYRVTWEIDIDADSVTDAALKAEQVLENMTYRPVLAVQRLVRNKPTGAWIEVDLDHLPLG